MTVMKDAGRCLFGVSPILFQEGEPMDENRTLEPAETEQVPYITREIDGSLYTVRIHFREDSRETAKEKVARLLVNDALNGDFPEKTH